MSTVDYYDVQAMIRDAVSELRGAIRTLESEVHQAIRDERDDRKAEDAALERMIASRTDHLV